MPPAPDLERVLAANSSVKDRPVLMRVLRPIGLYAAWAALRLGLRPIQMTCLTFVMGLGVCLLFAVGAEAGRLWGLGLMLAWQILDTADGSMARALGEKSNFGGFLDYAGGMFLLAFLHPCIALGLALHPEPERGPFAALARRPELLVFAGAASAASALLFRLLLKAAEARFQEKLGDDRILSRDRGARLSLFLKELEIYGGLQIAILAAGVLWKSLTAFVAGYCLLEMVLLGGVCARLFWGFRHFHRYPASYEHSPGRS